MVFTRECNFDRDADQVVLPLRRNLRIKITGRWPTKGGQDAASSHHHKREVVVWPVQDIRLVRGLCTRINPIIRKHPLHVGTPLAPVSAHAIPQYSVYPRPSFIAIHAIQYW